MESPGSGVGSGAGVGVAGTGTVGLSLEPELLLPPHPERATTERTTIAMPATF